MTMYSTEDVVLLLKAAQTAYLLSHECFSGDIPPGLALEAMVERWEEAVAAFMETPENETAKSRLNECVRELIEIQW